MSGLLGTLGMGHRALQAQRQGIEVTGHNLANVNNPDFARQQVEFSPEYATEVDGPTGVGVSVVNVAQVRDALIDSQLRTEQSITGSLESKISALEFAQASLGQAIDRQEFGTDGTAATQGSAGTSGIANSITGLFNAFQNVANDPTSLVERRVAIEKASNLAAQFNQFHSRLQSLDQQLDLQIEDDTLKANALLDEIALLNGTITRAESQHPQTANDLRDVRIKKLEELSSLIGYQTSPNDDAGTEIRIGGELVISGENKIDQLALTRDQDGKLSLELQNGGPVPGNVGGRIGGGIEAKDNDIQNLADNIDSLANTLITEVNRVHSTGFSLQGETGKDFFEGDSAASIAVKADLVKNPAAFQGSSDPSATGNNAIALALADLSLARHADLGNQTFSERFSETVAQVGQALQSTKANLEDQNAVESLLQQQRNSISGVSLDEEMTNLVKFQKAFQASARLISIVDDMLSTVVNLGN